MNDIRELENKHALQELVAQDLDEVLSQLHLPIQDIFYGYLAAFFVATLARKERHGYAVGDLSVRAFHGFKTTAVAANRQG